MNLWCINQLIIVSETVSVVNNSCLFQIWEYCSLVQAEN